MFTCWVHTLQQSRRYTADIAPENVSTSEIEGFTLNSDEAIDWYEMSNEEPNFNVPKTARPVFSRRESAQIMLTLYNPYKPSKWSFLQPKQSALADSISMFAGVAIDHQSIRCYHTSTLNSDLSLLLLSLLDAGPVSILAPTLPDPPWEFNSVFREYLSLSRSAQPAPLQMRFIEDCRWKTRQFPLRETCQEHLYLPLGTEQW